MEILPNTHLVPVDALNYLIGYLGALLVILAMFNVWKNKLDKDNTVNNFKDLWPNLSSWSYSNSDDWLLMIVGTPVFVFLQTALIYVVARYYEHPITYQEADFYGRIHYLISFMFGVMSQTIGVTLIWLGTVVINKVKTLFS